MSLKQTDSLKHWRNKTKRKFLDHVENETDLKIENFVDNFEWLFVDLIIWWEIIVCDFFFLTNDVSTFQENEYCKNRLINVENVQTRKSIVDWMSTNLDEQKNLLLNKCRKFEQKDRHNWFVDKILNFHHDWLIDFQNKKINFWFSFSQTHEYFR